MKKKTIKIKANNRYSIANRKEIGELMKLKIKEVDQLAQITIVRSRWGFVWTDSRIRGLFLWDTGR